ncbi:MAG: 2,3,4,5-tetrahydropyridine-2,6-dicarboxylate N-succinyltransferase [Holosporales bacterium]|jgi:2,3,4,5-tetrahydropyridine-2-carboxylate N-succinyltransferase|nr:2,3,4,5-tetrahydropyridine-2,6-dicarboxylate N-succinyltransferase [Holosporales bacterium]
MYNKLQKRIEAYSEEAQISNKSAMLQDIREVLDLLNAGKIRILDSDGSFNMWIKKAILLLFKHGDCTHQNFDAYDKVGVLPYDFNTSRYRKVPGAIIRDGVYIGDECVIMPSYINIGSYIGKRTMIDINASIGSCAQIGENCHISAGACIGGVLEPLVASPVVIGNNCFIGANSAVLEGVLVKNNSILAPGLVVSSSTKIIDREKGEKLPHGIIPENSVVVPGSYFSKNGVNINCAVIIKKTDGRSLDKVSINETLRSIEQ